MSANIKLKCLKTVLIKSVGLQGLSKLTANVQGLAKCGTSAFRLPGLLKLINVLLVKLRINAQ